jgi:hypothetical protein
MKSRGIKKVSLVPVTVRIPHRDLRSLLKAYPEIPTQSELIRRLLENELERIRSWEVHAGLEGTLTPEDIE